MDRKSYPLNCQTMFFKYPLHNLGKSFLIKKSIFCITINKKMNKKKKNNYCEMEKSKRIFVKKIKKAIN